MMLACGPAARAPDAGSRDDATNTILDDSDSPAGVHAFDPRGRYLAFVVGTDVVVWDLSVGRPLPRIQPGQGYVRALAFSPDVPRLFTGCDTRWVNGWDPATGTKTATLDASPNGRDLAWGAGARVAALAITPDGSCLGVTGPGCGASLFDLRTMQKRATIAGTNGGDSIDVARDGATFAIGSRDGLSIVDAARGTIVSNPSREPAPVVAFGPAGSDVVLVSRNERKTIEALDLSGRHPPSVFEQALHGALATNADGRLVAYVRQTTPSHASRELVVRDVLSGATVYRSVLENREIASRAIVDAENVRFDPTGRFLLFKEVVRTALYRLPDGDRLLFAMRFGAPLVYSPHGAYAGAAEAASHLTVVRGQQRSPPVYRADLIQTFLAGA
jgi:hypothetical protein